MKIYTILVSLCIAILFFNCSISDSKITDKLTVEKTSRLIKKDSSYVDLIRLVELIKINQAESPNNTIWKSKYKNLTYGQIRKYVNRINDKTWTNRIIKKSERAYENYTESLLKNNKPLMIKNMESLNIKENNPSDYIDIQIVDVTNSRGWYGCKADYTVFQFIPLQDTIAEVKFRLYAKDQYSRFITYDGAIKTEISDTIEILKNTGDDFHDLYCSNNTTSPIDEIKSLAEFTFLKQSVITKSGDTIFMPDPVINNQKYLTELKKVEETMIYDSARERLTIDDFKLSQYNSPKEITTTHSWWKWYYAIADNQLTDDEIYFILDPKDLKEYKDEYIESELKKYKPLAHEFYNELKEDSGYSALLNRYVGMQYLSNFQN